MIYRVRHKTVYEYSDPVSVAHHIVRLTPRTLARQKCLSSSISILPVPPAAATTHRDYFGNVVTSFGLNETHQLLTVEASSDLEVKNLPFSEFSGSLSWEVVRDTLPYAYTPEGLNAFQFVFDSKRVAGSLELAEYAEPSFPKGRPVLEAAQDLTSRIYRDFRFDTEATEVTTPVETFFEKRRGVCQDFSHLQIACLRSLGLPARYVSGYLRTYPPPGKPRLVGADASHAWCSVWCGPVGWVDFDPTNNVIPSDGHITVAWGRDYSDVGPIYGVLLGGARHKLHVSVDVLPLDRG